MFMDRTDMSHVVLSRNLWESVDVSLFYDVNLQQSDILNEGR